MVINARPSQCLMANLLHLSVGGGLEWRHALLPWIQDGTLQTGEKTINKLKSQNTEVVQCAHLG